jgi:predicted nucleotidyltransferase
MAIKERWQGFRELPPDVEQRLGRLIPLFEREGVLLAYLFGSLAQGREAHDVDLALLVRDQPAFRLRMPIADCLQTERVDLVDLRDAPPVLRFEIVRTGRLLYAADEEEQERFEMATIHLYRDTRFLRCQQRQYLRERFSDGHQTRSD